MRFICIVLLFGLISGCSAEFTDLRPNDAAPGNNTTSSNSATTTNVATGADAGAINNPTADSGPVSDSGSNNSMPGNETLIASGDFVNVDYETRGSAEYWELADGTYEVRLSMDFASQGVPGPALALSPRNPLGGSIDGDELDLGALTADSGAQSYTLPGEPTDYTYAWIWCKPFGLDVAFAEMEFQ